MKQSLLDLFSQHPQAAVAISMALSVLVAVLGVVPSVFITAANILFFGFWKGTALSFAGEALGAIIAFWLYRKGFRKRLDGTVHRYPRARRLLSASGREAFLLIFSLRLLPFVPSGLVTFAAAIGPVSGTTFFLASSLGKLPALLLEAGSVYGATHFGWTGRIALICLAAAGLVFAWRRNRKTA
ncbi:MAG: rane protein [Flaviaesturariibacter sp.]|nr:rane protein [Flaviaesturariibacter sp.]